MNRDEVISKVKALWAKADDAASTEHEKIAFRTKAAELMARYEVEQFDLDANTIEGGEHPIVIGQFLVKDKGELLIPDERILLAGSIARNFECKVIVLTFEYDSADEATGKPLKAGQYVQVIGYKHDYEMVQALYYNCIIDIISALMMEQQKKPQYQSQFALGYIDRLDQRLVEFYRRVNDWVNSGQVSDSTALAIRSRLQKVQDKFDEMYPNTHKIKMKQTKFDPNARRRGAARANNADIGGSMRLDGQSRASGEIGAEKRQLNR